jgi:hypothetical protein
VIASRKSELLWRSQREREPSNIELADFDLDVRGIRGIAEEVQLAILFRSPVALPYTFASSYTAHRFA